MHISYECHYLTCLLLSLACHRNLSSVVVEFILPETLFLPSIRGTSLIYLNLNSDKTTLVSCLHTGDRNDATKPAVPLHLLICTCQVAVASQ
uniref:Secreted protein n=1 Tax=Panagrellus redivivus TaxID=6233 RepID=A0A7E4V213_PANRE